MTTYTCKCGAEIGTCEWDDPSPEAAAIRNAMRCTACTAHISRQLTTCRVCGVVNGTMEVDDRLPPPDLEANTCGACSRNEEDGA